MSCLSTRLPTDAGDNLHEPVRNLTAIRNMLSESSLPAAVKERSIQVFIALGEAEAKTHGSTLDQVRLSCVEKLCRIGTRQEVDCSHIHLLCFARGAENMAD